MQITFVSLYISSYFHFRNAPRPRPPYIDGKKFIIKQDALSVAIVDDVKQAQRDAVDNADSIVKEARTARDEASNNAKCSDTIVSIHPPKYAHCN